MKRSSSAPPGTTWLESICTESGPPQGWPLWLMVAVMPLALSLCYVPVWLNFFPSGDDFSLIYNSANRFEPSFRGWFVDGYSRYFANYPEFSSEFTNFVRPVVNLTFYLESYLEPYLGFRAYLITNYVFYFMNAFAFWVLSRRLFRLPARWSLAGLALFCLSPTWGPVVLSPAFRTSELMTFFSLMSFLFIVRANRKNRAPCLAAALVSLSLAVLCHEMAVLSVIPAGLLWRQVATRGGGGTSFRGYSLFLVPVGVLVLVRLLLLAGHSVGVYPLRIAGDVPTYQALLQKLLGAANLYIAPFFPLGEPKDLLGLRGGLRQASGSAVVMLNAVAVALVAVTLWKCRPVARTVGGVALAMGICVAVLGLLAPDPRHAGVPVALGAAIWPVVICVSRQAAWEGNRPRLSALVSLLGWMPVMLLSLQFALDASASAKARVQQSDYARRTYLALEEVAERAHVEEILLLNDRVGGYGSLSMLRMAAWDAGRPGLRLRVGNGVVGSNDGAFAECAIVGECRGDSMDLWLRLGKGQELAFYGADLGSLLSTHPGRIEYEIESTVGEGMTAKTLRKLGLRVVPNRRYMTAPTWRLRYHTDTSSLAMVVMSPRDGTAFSVIGCRGKLALPSGCHSGSLLP